MACAVIVGRDGYFFDFLRCELDGLFSEFRRETDAKEVEAGDVCFIDADTSAVRTVGVPCFTFSRRGGCDFPLPAPLGSVRAAVLRAREAAPRLSLSDDGRTVMLGERTVRLSEGEFALLSRLFRAKGAYVGREELLSDVFGNAAEAGILNVYIHYLRKKLEAGDEKIIFSSRGDGYRLSERVFGTQGEKTP